MGDAPEKVWVEVKRARKDSPKVGDAWEYKANHILDVEYIRADLRLPPELLNRVRELAYQEPATMGLEMSIRHQEGTLRLLRDILEWGES